MRVLVARYRVRPGHGDEVEELLVRMGEAVARDEPGCLLYRAVRLVDDPDVFVLYEEYEDQAALEAHRATPHFRELIEGGAVPLLAGRDRDVGVPVRPGTGGGPGGGRAA